MFNRYITVIHKFPGFHAYEDAPDEVAFLRNNHRHLFHVNATIEVFHGDRELEFFMVQDMLINKILAYIQLKTNLGSCETIAEEIIKGLINAYGDHRYMYVSVSEDGENSGEVEWVPN